MAVIACRPWLEAELRAVDPAVIVCLGATAARAVLGRPVTIGAERGTPIPAADRVAVVTIHPSAVLRLRDTADRQAAIEGLVGDLKAAADAAGSE